MSETTNKESYIDEAKRRIAHLSYKLEQSEEKIKKLEYDNAELQRWANDICLPKLSELSDEERSLKLPLGWCWCRLGDIILNIRSSLFTQ